MFSRQCAVPNTSIIGSHATKYPETHNDCQVQGAQKTNTYKITMLRNPIKCVQILKVVITQTNRTALPRTSDWVLTWRRSTIRNATLPVHLSTILIITSTRFAITFPYLSHVRIVGTIESTASWRIRSNFWLECCRRFYMKLKCNRLLKMYTT